MAKHKVVGTKPCALLDNVANDSHGKHSSQSLFILVQYAPNTDLQSAFDENAPRHLGSVYVKQMSDLTHLL